MSVAKTPRQQTDNTKKHHMEKPMASKPALGKWFGIALLGLASASFIGALFVEYRLFAGQGLHAAGLWRNNVWQLLEVGRLQITTAVALFLAVWWSLKVLPFRIVARVLAVTALLTCVACLLIKPTRSQDFYHDALLLKDWLKSAKNPYAATPGMSTSPWLQYVSFWRDVPYIYGPLFAIFFGLIAVLGGSLGGALVVAKLMAIAALALTGSLIWKMTKQLALPKRLLILTVIFFNPITLQSALIEAHSDVFIGLGITASYFFLQKKQHSKALFLLIVVCLCKVVGLILLPVPIILMALAIKRPILPAARRLAGLAAAFIGFSLICFLPFGVTPVLHGLSWIANFREYGFESSGSLFLMKFLHVSPYAIRFVGLGLGLLVATLLARSDSPRRYTWPFIVFMFFGFAVFQPWYLLWILPLLCVTEPLWVVAVLTATFSVLSPNINNSVNLTTQHFAVICVAILALQFAYKALLRTSLANRVRAAIC
jgi:alpha-1,6-mannosyltransferase